MSRQHAHSPGRANAVRAGCMFLTLCLFAPAASATDKCERGRACTPNFVVATPTDRSPGLGKAAVIPIRRQCLGSAVHISAATPNERRLACAAANDAIQLLGRCGISPLRPLHLEIIPEVRHPVRGVIFGLFDPKREKVLVTQEANIPSLVKGTPYANLPRRDFYRSLIVHEVVHGIMHQNYKRRPGSNAAYEYPAYVLQIEALPQSVRNKFLQTIPGKADSNGFIFNDIVLFFDPFFFAAKAYEHFTASSAGGCALFRALLAGDAEFIPILPP